MFSNVLIRSLRICLLFAYVFISISISAAPITGAGGGQSKLASNIPTFTTGDKPGLPTQNVSEPRKKRILEETYHPRPIALQNRSIGGPSQMGNGSILGVDSSEMKSLNIHRRQASNQYVAHYGVPRISPEQTYGAYGDPYDDHVGGTYDDQAGGTYDTQADGTYDANVGVAYEGANEQIAGAYHNDPVGGTYYDQPGGTYNDQGAYDQLGGTNVQIANAYHNNYNGGTYNEEQTGGTYNQMGEAYRDPQISGTYGEQVGETYGEQLDGAYDQNGGAYNNPQIGGTYDDQIDGTDDQAGVVYDEQLGRTYDDQVDRMYEDQAGGTHDQDVYYTNQIGGTDHQFVETSDDQIRGTYDNQMGGTYNNNQIGDTYDNKIVGKYDNQIGGTYDNQIGGTYDHQIDGTNVDGNSVAYPEDYLGNADQMYPLEFTPLGKAPPVGQAREDNILHRQFGDYFTDFDDEIAFELPGNLHTNCWLQSMLAVRWGFGPNCNVDGTYSSKQCYQKRCWCTDKQGNKTQKTGGLHDDGYYFHLRALTLQCSQN